MINSYKIGRVSVSAVNIPTVITAIRNAIANHLNTYICVSNMRTVQLGNRDDNYFQVMNNSYMNIPDGTPLVWCARTWGLKNVQRTCGPEVFDIMLRDKEIKHFFLGDTDQTLENLRKKCEAKYGTNVVGMFSPPFMPIEKYDLEQIADMINTSGANIVWLSLTAPKQDYLAAKLQPLLLAKICIGVGAAFRVFTGDLQLPKNTLIQKIGLSGLILRRGNRSILHELKFYIVSFGKLLCYIVCIFFNRLGINTK